MINIKVYPVTEIGTNCCYLIDEATGESAVLDPGGKSDRLLRQIADFQKMPQPFRDFREVDAIQHIRGLFPIPAQILPGNLQIV